MSDPLGFIAGSSPLSRVASPGGFGAPRPCEAGQPDFKQFLREQIDEVNRMQSDATSAVEDLATGRRDDLEGVLIATQKADVAFRMLLQVRNKVMEAYEEVKQIRV